MKIYVNRIPHEGIREETAYDPTELDVERSDVHVDTPICVSSFIVKTEGEMVVQADIRCELQLSCARCLEPFAVPLMTAATLSYPVEPTDIVDITDDIRQEVMLAYPMAPVCRADCRGLCGSCGRNLNVGTCEHHAR